jgi:hypothetical protein
VYFALELHREGSAGSYFGRLAECPNPYVRPTEPADIKVRLKPNPQPGFLSVIATPDLGDVINATLEDTGLVMRDFWKVAAQAPNPEEEFRRSWAGIADAFARANARYANGRRRFASHRHWEEISTTIECLVVVGGSGLCACKLVVGQHPGPELQHIIDEASDVIDALHTYGRHIQIAGEQAEDWIRSGLTEARMIPRTRDTLVGAAGVRLSVAPPPIDSD